MSAQVSGADVHLQRRAPTRRPAAGSYRFALFNERDPRLGGEVGSDVNRDGNPAGSSGIFAVLWDAGHEQVWVDTNQNSSFADELAMTDYKVAVRRRLLRHRQPGDAGRRAMPFVVQTDGKTRSSTSASCPAQHGSHVAGIVAGN